MSLPTTNTGYPSVQQHQPEAEPSLTTMQLGLGSPSPQAIGVPVSPSPSSPATATPHAATTPILPTAASPALSPSPARWRGPPNPHDAEQLREHQERELRYGLQARGQNYNVSGKAVWGRGRSKAWEWEERQRRDEAASILDSEEMIMWFSAARNESITQTRAHYRNVLLGLEDCAQDSVVWRDEWEVPQQQHQHRDAESFGGAGSPMRSGQAKDREIARMKKRVSLGQEQ